MKDLFPRIISAIFYVLAILGSIYYGFKSFIILLILFCVIIIIEYGKVLRKDEEHFEFIKYGSRYGLAPGFFMNTEFLPLFFSITFGLLPIMSNEMSIEDIGPLIVLFLFVNILLSIIHLYCLFLNKKLFKYKKISKVWPLFGVNCSFLLIIYSIMSFDFVDIKKVILAYLFLIWGIDTVGYLIGVNYGKTKLFESLSPKKNC